MQFISSFFGTDKAPPRPTPSSSTKSAPSSSSSSYFNPLSLLSYLLGSNTERLLLSASRASIYDKDVKDKPYTPHKPGKFDSLTDKLDSLELPAYTFSGLQVNVQNISESAGFLTCHAFALGKRENINPLTGEKDDERSAYNFLAYMKSGQLSVNARYGTGNILRGVLDYESEHWKAEVQSYISSNNMHFEGDLTLDIHDCSLQLKYLGSAVGAAYSQGFSNGYAFGTEFITTGADTRSKWVVTRNTPSWFSSVALTSGLGPTILNLGYVQKDIHHPEEIPFERDEDFSIDLAAGLDLTFSPKSGLSSVTKLGYQVVTSKTRQYLARGYFDTSGKGCLLMERMVSQNMSVQVSTNLDILKGVYDFGIGCNVAYSSDPKYADPLSPV